MTTEKDWAAERQRFADDNSPGGLGTNLPASDPSGQDAAGAGDDSLLGAQFAQLSRRLFSAETLPAMVQHIVDMAPRVVPGAEFASMTLRDEHGRFSTPAETDELATVLDELQYSHNEGPCVAATRVGGTGIVSSLDVTADPQFPAWGPDAAAHGVRSVLGVGLFPDGDPPRLGSVNCYSTEAHGLAAADHDVALLLASHAATALAAQHAITAAQTEAEQLREGLHNRDVIGQAKGILMQRRKISAGEAFDVLRRASQELNTKLAQIAHTLTQHPDQLL